MRLPLSLTRWGGRPGILVGFAGHLGGALVIILGGVGILVGSGALSRSAGAAGSVGEIIRYRL